MDPTPKASKSMAVRDTKALIKPYIDPCTNPRRKEPMPAQLLTRYHKLIVKATGVKTKAEAQAIENIMRAKFLFLNGLDANDLTKLAKQAKKALVAACKPVSRAKQVKRKDAEQL